MTLHDAAERVWFGTGPGARAARAALAPLGALFRLGVAARDACYDAGFAPTLPLAMPAVSVGNLTVGGTGKTPVAAWAAGELARRGARPAVVLRGVGDDESRVHALLNPDVPVVADADRVRGVARAAALGANAAVLDDAFQHRRARRDVDLVLVAAETFDGRARLLPAGPYREPFAALARATAVVVTRKSAPASRARAVADEIGALAGRADLPVAIAHLAPSAVIRWRGGAVEDVGSLDRVRVLAVAGVGAPDAFAAQLRDAGATVVLVRHPDHHAYDDADVARIVERARSADRIVTTLKDAVKLAPRWPRDGPALWYVSQRVTLEAGAPALAALLDALAASTRAVLTPAPDSAARGRHA